MVQGYGIGFGAIISSRSADTSLQVDPIREFFILEEISEPRLSLNVHMILSSNASRSPG